MSVIFDILFRGNSTSFEAAAKRVKNIGQQLSNELGKTLSGRLQNLVGVAAIEEFGRGIIQFADNITDLSTRLGVSTQHLQEWGYAASHSGSSLETVTKFLEELGVAREKAIDGDKDLIRSFKQLGISLSDLKSQNINDIALKIATTVKGKNPQDVVASLKEVGGKSAPELITAMKSGIQELADEAEQAGQILDDTLLESLKALKNEFLSFIGVLRGPFAQGLSYLREGLGAVFDLMRIVAGGVGAFIGTLLGGGSLNAALQEFKIYGDNVIAQREKSEQAIADQAANRKSTSETPYKSSKSPKQEFTDKKETADLNNWQKLGSAIRFSADTKQITILDQISRNTGKTEVAISGLKEEIRKLSGWNKSSANSSFGP